MIPIYAREAFPYPESTAPALFLAGPTPREAEVQSWRPEALKILEAMSFQGHVFVPEDRYPGRTCFEHGPEYGEQIEWEEKGLLLATCIIFWIPRNLKTLPGMTTNIEWGCWQDSGKVVLGAPKDAPKMEYMRYYAKKLGVPTAETLLGTLALGFNKACNRRLWE